MAAKPVALILGAGPRVGSSVAEKFASNGYKVAVASRSGTTTINGATAFKADFSKPSSIPTLFEDVKAKLQAAPNVVIYNAAALTPPPDNESALSITAESFESDLNINTISAYVAAQQAVKAWETLPQDTKKTFIYTGNILNTVVLPVPLMLTLGVGKAASAYWVGVADALYKSKGFRFFYADERQPDGQLKGGALDGAAHAEFYAQLADHADVPWEATFVKDKGFVEFK